MAAGEPLLTPLRQIVSPIALDGGFPSSGPRTGEGDKGPFLSGAEEPRAFRGDSVLVK